MTPFTLNRLPIPSLIFTVAQAADVDITFNLQNTRVAPDGFTRTGVIVSHVFPGTLIQANKDDMLHITINDQLTDPTMRTASEHGLRARVNVVQGKRYRFRVVNISAYATFQFSIEGHHLTIIEVDGINHVLHTVGSFDIYVAQRYSVVLNANRPVANYWIHGPMTLQRSSDNKNLDTDDVYAVLHYAGAPDVEPTTQADISMQNLFQEYQLAALENPGAPGGSTPADCSIGINFGMEVKNGKIMVNLSLAIIIDIAKAIFIPSIQSMQGPLNYVNPPRRDVVGIGGSTVIVRFQANNPGPWFIHCHIDWHLEVGLAVVFAERPVEQISGPQSEIIKQTWLDLCPICKALPADQQ